LFIAHENPPSSLNLYHFLEYSTLFLGKKKITILYLVGINSSREVLLVINKNPEVRFFLTTGSRIYVEKSFFINRS